MTQPQKHLQRIDKDGARDLLLRASNIVLTTHMNPDGDALGSEGGLYYFLKWHGKNVRIINTSPVPPNLTILGEDGIFEEYAAAAHDPVIATADLIGVLDLNAISRVDRMATAVTASKAARLVIDHHIDPKAFADYYWVDTEMSATGEMIYDIITFAGAPAIDRKTALHLYVAIMTDTGSFRFERTTPKVHRIAAELLATGLQPPEIHESVFDSFPLNRAILLGIVLENIRPVCDGNATILTVTQAMMERTGTNNDDTEGMVNFGLGIAGVKATALITELDDCIKISFRSRGTAHVNGIAKQFGGGGHLNAAAARIYGGDLDKTGQDVEAAFCVLFGESPGR